MSDALKPEIQQVYEEIIHNWSVEAKKENSAYFYNVSEVSAIINGQKTYVIGRKGSGKSAIAQHLSKIHDYKTFTKKLSFKNFPFNILYSLANQQEYTVPNQFISIWKYLILSCICKMMIDNQNIDAEVRDKLISLYGDSSLNRLNKLLEKWTSTGFGAEILGVGFNCEYQREKTTISWIEALEILQEVILDYCDDARYFIVFDELDEDYKAFTSDEEKENYNAMLISLFKATQDIRCTFDENEKNIYPVVFLRSDIYAQLKDSDKNKWRESVINMEWDSSKIKKMLAHRLSVAYGVDDTDFDDIWHKLFSKEPVRMGNRQAKEMDIFSYIERSTEMRPRDFIQYVKECVIIANDILEAPISSRTVKSADDNFSDYLYGETIDELFPVIPEIEEIMGLFSTIRKQTFRYDTFTNEYNNLLMNRSLEKRDVRYILLMLFDAGVIGNKPSMRGQTIFSFSKRKPRFNFNETMVIHRGLYKALQIF